MQCPNGKLWATLPASMPPPRPRAATVAATHRQQAPSNSHMATLGMVVRSIQCSGQWADPWEDSEGEMHRVGTVVGSL